MELNNKQIEKSVDKIEMVLFSKGYKNKFHIYLDHSGSIGKILREFLIENKSNIENERISQIVIDTDVMKTRLTGECVNCTFSIGIDKKSGLSLNEMSICYLLGQDGQMSKTLPISRESDVPSIKKAIKEAEIMRWGKQKTKKNLRIWS